MGFCTIIYELLIGAVSSYLLGDSITQFSLVIGLTMTAMGIGTLISRVITKDLIFAFIMTEVFLAILGGLCVPILYWAYTIKAIYFSVMCLMIFGIGALIGLEIPLLTRIMEKHYDLKNNISNVLSLDYLGAFLASLAFPFFLLPFCGVFDSSIIAGFFNLLVGTMNFYWFRNSISPKNSGRLKIFFCLLFVLLLGLFVLSKEIMRCWENRIFRDSVIYSTQTKYQHVVVTKYDKDIRLFIDGNIQFSSIDEHRYHELLVHIPLSLTEFRENILILGGGDGLAAREILKYDDVKSITIVDLDKEITDLFGENALLKLLNENSLINPKVKIINEDAFKFMENTDEFYDVIIIDLPDPNNSSIARLYSREFYKVIARKLSKNGIVVTQASSPFFSCEAFWCVNETFRSAGYNFTYQYHGYIPSFGDWGFVMASNNKLDVAGIKIGVHAKYLDEKIAQKSFLIEKDIVRNEIAPSSLNEPKILEYYINGWKYWN